MIETNEVDGVVLGRALLADPDFVERAKKKNAMTRSLLVRVGGVGCVGEQTKRRPASCVINPLAGRETGVRGKAGGIRKKMLGSSERESADLPQARILAKRGHHVVVF
ncbi:MAG: hypothetical protein V8S75_00005 [[Ruminococcus] torques]